MSTDIHLQYDDGTRGETTSSTSAVQTLRTFCLITSYCLRMVGTMMLPVQKASCQWPVSFQAAMSSGDKLCPFLTSRVSPRNVTYHIRSDIFSRGEVCHRCVFGWTCLVGLTFFAICPWRSA